MLSSVTRSGDVPRKVTVARKETGPATEEQHLSYKPFLAQVIHLKHIALSTTPPNEEMIFFFYNMHTILQESVTPMLLTLRNGSVTILATKSFLLRMAWIFQRWHRIIFVIVSFVFNFERTEIYLP